MGKIFVRFENTEAEEELTSLMNEMNDIHRKCWDNCNDAIVKIAGEQNGRSGFYLVDVSGSDAVDYIHLLFVRFLHHDQFHFEPAVA